MNNVVSLQKPWRHGLLKFALLAGRKVPIFPCNPKTKAPLTPHGFKDATCDQDQIRKWWTQWPHAFVGMPTGSGSGYFVADLDCKEGKANGVIEWPKLLAESCAEEIDTRQVETPSGGQHLVFKHAEGVRNVPLDKLWPGVEIKGEGGYVIIPPSKGYKLMNDVEPIQAPQWLLDRIAAYAGSNGNGSIVHIGSDDGLASLEELGLAMAVIPNHSEYDGYDNWNRIGMALYRASNGQAFNLFDKWSSQNSKYDASYTRRKWKDHSRSPVRDLGAGTIFYEAQQHDPFWRDTVQTVELDKLGSKLVAGLLGHAEEEPDKKEFDEIPTELLEVPGLVGEISNWITATAKHKQPLLSLAAALGTVGTAVGRKIAGPTRSGTHLYYIGVAPTGAGKNHPMSAVDKIFTACGPAMAAYMGPPEFTSMPAFVHFLQKQPLSFCPMDEIGSFLKRINSKRAGGFEASLSAELRRSWGSSFDKMRTAEWAQTPSVTIHAPAFSLFGMSTQKEFYNSLRGEDVVNGLLNRCLVLETATLPSYHDPELDPDEVPRNIIKKLQTLNYRGASLYTAVPQPTILDESPEAKNARLAFAKEMENRSAANSDVGAFLVRASETAIRLATIVTAGQEVDCIESDVMRWAISFTRWSYDRLVTAADMHIADSDTQGIANEIKRIVKKKAGRKGWARMSDVWRLLKHKHKRRDVEDVMSMILQSGEIISKKTVTEKGGPATNWLKPEKTSIKSNR